MSGQAAGDFVEGNTSYVRREPLGVVLGITPVELPTVASGSGSSAQALAAGNTVVIKPAELTPLATTPYAASASRSCRPAY